jgi:hypothetical protein
LEADFLKRFAIYAMFYDLPSRVLHDADAGVRRKAGIPDRYVFPITLSLL